MTRFVVPSEGPDEGPHLPAAMQEVRRALPEADNLGRSADARNVYALIDELTAAVQADLPRSLCGAGCGHCCAMHRALIRVFRSEWDVVHDHLVATRSESELSELVETFWERYTPYLPLLEHVQKGLESGEPLKPAASELPVSCPLLDVSGSCSVYPVRPAICRGYGLFSLEREGYGWIFACKKQQQALEEQLGEAGGPKLRLPSFGPLYQKVADLCEDEPKQLIPLWFAQSFPRRR